jgi:hypothetical protein
MSQPNSPEETNIESRVRQLLAQYADEAPREANLEARVRDLLTSQPPRRHSAAPRLPSWGRLGGWARAGVSVALVLVLLAGFFAVLRLRANTANTTHCPIVQAQGKIKLCSNQHIGVSFTVGQTFADPTRTVAELHFKMTGANLPFGHEGALEEPNLSVFSWDIAITDSQGHSYGVNPLATSLPGADRYANVSATPTHWAEFDPLPQTMLSAPQTLTLRLNEVMLNYSPASFGQPYMPYIVIRGPWTTTFQVTPQPGRSISFHAMPQTHNGITIQPLRLDADPTGAQFDQAMGGERLVLRVSGLPPNTQPHTLGQWATKFTYANGTESTSTGSPNPVLNFEGQYPAYAAGMAAGGPLVPKVVAGPSGTLDVEVIFLLPSLPNLSGAQTLTISGITNESGGVTQGPWDFTLSLG